MKRQFADYVKVFLVCLVGGLAAGAGFWACEIEPMTECQDKGHSVIYCYKLLHRD